MRNRIVSPFKRARLVVVSAVLLALSVTGLAKTQGPDTGGYTGTDETVYSLVDASQGGAGILAGSDDGTAALTLPFVFHFYGLDYPMACVSANGALYFIQAQADCTGINDFANTDLTNTSPLATPTLPGGRPGVFPFWSDLTFDQPGAGSVLYKTEGPNGSRQFVVQWNNAFPTTGAANPVTFEVILYETSNQILFQYKTLGAAGNGSAATVGIRDAGSMVSGKRIGWSSNAPVIADNSAILFVGSRADPGISLTAGTVKYNGSPRNATGFAYGAGGTSDVLSPPVTFSYVGTGSTSYGPTTVAPTNVGSYDVTASFIGNADYKSATTTGSLTIESATLTYNATPVSRQYNVVNPSFAGTVTGFQGTDTEGNATTGVRTFTSPATQTSNVGSYAINGSGLSANFGNYTFAQAAGNATALTITQADQTITFTSSPSSPTVGGPTYTVVATGGPSGNPVTFSSLTSGICTVAGSIVSFVGAGTCTIAADQAGNGNYKVATQATQGFLVAGGGTAATATTIGSSSYPSSIGFNVTFTATVKRTSNNTLVTSGTVTFKEGSTVLAGPTALNASGQASFATASLTGGSHTITAVFNGTASFATSSGSVVQVVNKLSTTTNLYSTNNPSEFSDTVVFTAWVHRGFFPVGGTVTFKDGTTTLAANVPLNAFGLAFFWTSSLGVGTHPISVVYNGTGTYATSSDSLNQVVTRASTRTSLVSSVNPSNLNQNVTFTATVRHDGQAVTTGTVTFMEGATVLAGPTSVNSSGTASFSKSNLTSGNHNITAVYNTGNPNYRTSSGSVTQIVRAASGAGAGLSNGLAPQAVAR